MNVCQLGDDGRGNTHERNRLRCALPGWSDRNWGPPITSAPHMGRLPLLNERSFDGNGDPAESTDEGCPGSWYRCEWTSSVSRYERMLTESGFSENLHLSRSDDRLLLDAAAYLEVQRVRAMNHDSRKRAEHLRRTNGSA